MDEMIKPDRVSLIGLGLERAEMTPNHLIETAQAQAEHSRLSLGDCAALITARDLGATLLTGDQRLRQHAEEAGIPVHGVLRILDRIEAADLLTGPELAAALRGSFWKALACLPPIVSCVSVAGSRRNSDVFVRIKHCRAIIPESDSL